MLIKFLALIITILHLSNPKLISFINTSSSLIKPSPITVESIFSDSTNNHLPNEKLITLTVTGDVLLARLVNREILRQNDPLYPFYYTKDLLTDSDITFINLETPVFKGCPVVTEGVTFCGEVLGLDGLVSAGIDIVNLANNHTFNYGVSKFNETAQRLESLGIKTTGINGATYYEVKGIKFAFLGYNGVGRGFDKEKIKREISEAREMSDVVVVQPHWGREYVSAPQSSAGIAPDSPREIAHLFIDSGADLVVGNHPHWVQGVEIYKDRFIAYSHGNFVFDQLWSQETREGAVGTYIFLGKKLVDVKFTPVYIDKIGQPKIAVTEHAQKILNRMKAASTNLD